MSAKNYNSSDLTNKIRNQTIYANYIIQRQKMNQGCSPFISIEGGSGSQKESSIWIDIQQATAQTTLAEQQAVLANNNCPNTNVPNVTVDPYLTDKIYASLTTNATAYQSAAVGSWVKITSSEYDALKTTVSNTTTVGANNSLMTGLTQGIVTTTSIFANRYNGTSRVAIPISNYFFAVSFVTNRDSQTGIRIFVNSNSTSNTGYVQQGDSLPATSVASGSAPQYYVLKGQSTATSASNTTSLAAYSPSTGASTGIQVTDDPVPQTNRIDWVSTGGSIPTSSTVLSNDYGGYVVMIQGISASSIQWVTS